VKLDAHVHTRHSGRTSLYPLSLIMRESYNRPEHVYRLAKARGMDLVAVTDHDCVAGALALADKPDVIVGCEVTAAFPRDGVRVHLNVLDITEAQFLEIERRRHDVAVLLPYLREAGIFTSLNHVASRVNGLVDAAHVAALVPWIDAIEVRNGSRLATQNLTAAALADATGLARLGGSDAHTTRGIGRTWVEAPQATCRASFLRELRAGRVVPGGRHGHYVTMASDILRFATSLAAEQVAGLRRRPLAWQQHALAVGAVIRLPLVLVPLALAAGHFVLEARFNRRLLVDLVARPSARTPRRAALSSRSRLAAEGVSA
jgi:predicted metal-dependent phosphoesterase TrpH